MEAITTKHSKDQIDNYPSTWPMGKVVNVHPGDDGNIRVVPLQHENGISKQPIKNLCFLPIDGNKNLYSASLDQPEMKEQTDTDKNIVTSVLKCYKRQKSEIKFTQLLFYENNLLLVQAEAELTVRGTKFLI